MKDRFQVPISFLLWITKCQGRTGSRYLKVTHKIEERNLQGTLIRNTFFFSNLVFRIKIFNVFIFHEIKCQSMIKRFIKDF